MRLRVLVLPAAVILVSCKSPHKAEAPPPSSQSEAWPNQMQSMAADVKKLLPFIYDRAAFHDVKNRTEIRKYLQEFSKAADHINAGAGKPFIKDDLLLSYSIENLKEDLNRAVHSFDVGQLEYARSVAKASMSHCFRCHSVTQAGNSAGWDLDQVHSLSLAPIEKADLLVATRKYDKALAYMESQLRSEEFQKNYAFDFESMLRRYLAVMIRVENAPQRAQRELDRILERESIPHYIVEQAQGWRQSLKAWASEKKQPVRNATDLFAQVEKRFKRAAEIQHYEKDHAGDVEYLRATAALHEGMKLAKTPEENARALYLLGRAYEVLDELGSWNLHEVYYESCLLKDPKSPLAQRCFNRLEASLYMGYSGSAGMNLPPEERERLRRLKEKMQKQ